MAIRVKADQYGLRYKSKFPGAHKDDISADLGNLIEGAANRAAYWEEFKAHPNRTHHMFTFEAKCKILGEPRFEGLSLDEADKERDLFFKHLETGDFANALFSDAPLYPEDIQKVINVLKSIISTQAGLNAFLKQCPNTLAALNANQKLAVFAKDNVLLALVLFRKPSLIAAQNRQAVLSEVSQHYDNNLEVAVKGQKHIPQPPAAGDAVEPPPPSVFFPAYDKAVCAKNLAYFHRYPITCAELAKLTKGDLAVIFSLEEEQKPYNPKFFLQNFYLFQKYCPVAFKALLKEVAQEEQANYRPAADAPVTAQEKGQEKGKELFRKHLYHADYWASEQVGVSKKRAARDLNDETAELLQSNIENCKLLYLDGDQVLNDNIVKLLSLTRHSEKSTLKFTDTLLKRKALPNEALGKVAPYMSQFLKGDGFNKWWRSLKSNAKNFVLFVKERINSKSNLAAQPLQPLQVSIINNVLADKKVRGKLDLFRKGPKPPQQEQQQVEQQQVEQQTEISNIVSMLNADQLSPVALKGLALDSELWPEIKRRAFDNQSPEVKLEFLSKSIYFYPGIVGIPIIDLLLDRPYCPKSHPNISEENYQKSQAGFQSILNGLGDRFDQIIESDTGLINCLLQYSTRASTVPLYLLASKSPSIMKAIVSQGYLHKIFDMKPAGPFQGLTELHSRFITGMLQLDLSATEKKYAFEYFRRYATTAQLHELAFKYPAETSMLYDATIQQQHWVQDSKCENIDLKFEGNPKHFIELLVDSVPPERLSPTLLKAVVYWANSPDYKELLDELLNCKLSRLGKTVQKDINSYIKAASEYREKMKKWPPHFQSRIDQAIQSPLLHGKLNFTGQQLYTLIIDGMDPLSLKAISLSPRLSEILSSYSSSLDLPVQQALQDKSPYFHIHDLYKEIILEDERVELISDLIFNINKGEFQKDGIDRFPRSQVLFTGGGAYGPAAISALLERDGPLRKAIFERYFSNNVVEKNPEDFKIIKKHSGLLPFLLPGLPLSNEQCVQLSLAVPAVTHLISDQIFTAIKTDEAIALGVLKAASNNNEGAVSLVGMIFTDKEQEVITKLKDCLKDLNVLERGSLADKIPQLRMAIDDVSLQLSREQFEPQKNKNNTINVDTDNAASSSATTLVKENPEGAKRFFRALSTKFTKDELNRFGSDNYNPNLNDNNNVPSQNSHTGIISQLNSNSNDKLKDNNAEASKENNNSSPPSKPVNNVIPPPPPQPKSAVDTDSNNSTSANRREPTLSKAPSFFDSIRSQSLKGSDDRFGLSQELYDSIRNNLKDPTDLRTANLYLKQYMQQGNVLTKSHSISNTKSPSVNDNEALANVLKQAINLRRHSIQSPNKPTNPNIPEITDEEWDDPVTMAVKKASEATPDTQRPKGLEELGKLLNSESGLGICQKIVAEKEALQKLADEAESLTTQDVNNNNSFK
ncbi:MAG: hypothetical protein H0U71_07140 [Gammaproteobacteria bacterium]|nr:hypothetical protein [Gammaproteobacteria bacterium]